MKHPRWVSGFASIRWAKVSPWRRGLERKSAEAALNLNGFEPTEAAINAVVSLHRSMRRTEQLAFMELMHGTNQQPEALLLP
jgi:hypothetical protein